MRILNKILFEAQPFDMFNHSILLCYRGSIAHGTYIPNENPNSIDDKDIIGVAIPPKEIFFSLNQFEQFEKIEQYWDVLIYEFRKCIRLMLKSNPNVIQILWTPEKYFLKISEEGKLLIENRSLFISKKIYKSFCGYSRGQMYKMEYMTYHGYMGEKRKQLVNKYGYDCKNAQHLIRLLRQGIELLSNGELIVERPDRSELIQIKSGMWSIEKVKKEAEKLFAEMENAYQKSNLPEEPNYKKINKLVIEILDNYFWTRNWAGFGFF